MSFNELRPNFQFQTTAANISCCISLISVSLLMNRIASAKSLNSPDNDLDASVASLAPLISFTYATG